MLLATKPEHELPGQQEYSLPARLPTKSHSQVGKLGVVKRQLRVVCKYGYNRFVQPGGGGARLL